MASSSSSSASPFWLLVCFAVLLARGFGGQINLSVSRTIASGMVLQRDVPNTIWGFAPPGTTVTVALSGLAAPGTGEADASGIWRAKLSPMAANAAPANMTITAPGAVAISLTDIVVGDVILCSGQSNMQLSINMGLNATAELAASDALGPWIRVMYVTETGVDAPSLDLAPPAIGWSRASAAVLGGQSWAGFSAQCWYTGRDLFQALGGKVPIGLIESCVGGTAIRQWAPASALARCPQPYNSPQPYGVHPYAHSTLYNGMIAPFGTGPTSLKFVLWDQAESDSFPQTPVGYYGCQATAQVAAWRAALANPVLPWILVHLQPYTGADPCCMADLRSGQLAPLVLGNVGYATAMDLGDLSSPYGNVHFRNKQAAAARVVTAALALAYGDATGYPPPAFLSQTALNSTTVVVSFDAPGSLALLPEANVTCPLSNSSWCTGFEVLGSDGSTYPATATLMAPGTALAISNTTALPSGVYVVGSAYAWSLWPRVLLYHPLTGLPVLPWRQALTLAGPA